MFVCQTKETFLVSVGASKRWKNFFLLSGEKFSGGIFRRQCVGKANRNKGISYNAVRGQALETAVRGETETILLSSIREKWWKSIKR